MKRFLLVLFSIALLACGASAQELPPTKFYGNLNGEPVVLHISASHGSLLGNYVYANYPKGENPQLVGRLNSDWTFTAEVGDESGRPKEAWSGRVEFGHVTTLVGTWSVAAYGTSGPFRFVDDPSFQGD